MLWLRLVVDMDFFDNEVLLLPLLTPTLSDLLFSLFLLQSSPPAVATLALPWPGSGPRKGTT